VAPLYRKAIESPLTSSAHEVPETEREKRYAADPDPDQLGLGRCELGISR
jgi:hypothetical protein